MFGKTNKISKEKDIISDASYRHQIEEDRIFMAEKLKRSKEKEEERLIKNQEKEI
jgi:hypothetical protein